jgi:DNA repair protein REV1
MYLGKAKELCPSLIVLPYDFDGYEEVSEAVATVLFAYAAQYDGVLEQVSCDEAYLELNVNCHSEGSQTVPSVDLLSGIAESIRCDVFRATQCTCSVGVGANKLLAKLGTDRVKPNGSFVVSDFKELLSPLNLRDLHGVGHHLNRKLVEEGLETVQDVWNMGAIAETELSRILGLATGRKVWDACCGRDDRRVEEAARKSIGAEVSRLRTRDSFLGNLRLN